MYAACCNSVSEKRRTIVTSYSNNSIIETLDYTILIVYSFITSLQILLYRPKRMCLSRNTALSGIMSADVVME